MELTTSGTFVICETGRSLMMDPPTTELTNSGTSVICETGSSLRTDPPMMELTTASGTFVTCDRSPPAMELTM
jgi:hypothetical protein